MRKMIFTFLFVTLCLNNLPAQNVDGNYELDSLVVKYVLVSRDINQTGTDGNTEPIVDVIKNLASELSDIGEELGSINRLNFVNNILDESPLVDTMREIYQESSLVELVKELQKKLLNSLSEDN